MTVWIVSEQEQGSCSCSTRYYISGVFSSEEKAKTWIQDQIKWWSEKGFKQSEYLYDIDEQKVQ